MTRSANLHQNRHPNVPETPAQHKALLFSIYKNYLILPKYQPLEHNGSINKLICFNIKYSLIGNIWTVMRKTWQSNVDRRSKIWSFEIDKRALWRQINQPIIDSSLIQIIWDISQYYLDHCLVNSYLVRLFAHLLMASTESWCIKMHSFDHLVRRLLNKTLAQGQCALHIFLL